MHDVIAALLSFGYGGIALLMLVETIVPVIPTEVVLASSGVAVAHGSLAFWPLVLASTIGSTIGNIGWFMVGNRLGYERLRPLVERHGRWLTVDWSSVQRGTAFLRRHGHWVVGAMRVSPVMRTMISVPAGLVHMRLWLFIAFTMLGTATWNGLWIAGGHWLSPHLAAWHTPIAWALGGVAVVIAALYAWRVTHWRPR